MPVLLLRPFTPPSTDAYNAITAAPTLGDNRCQMLSFSTYLLRLFFLIGLASPTLCFALDVDDIIRNPEQYDNKRITVCGKIYIGYEAHDLNPRGETRGNGPDTAIWLRSHREMWDGWDVLFLGGHLIVVEGTFHYSANAGFGHLGLYKMDMSDVTTFQSKGWWLEIMKWTCVAIGGLLVWAGYRVMRTGRTEPLSGWTRLAFAILAMISGAMVSVTSAILMIKAGLS